MAELVGLRAAFVLPTVYAAAFAIVGLGLDKGADAADAGATASRGTGLRSAMSLLGLRGIQVTLLLTFVRIWVNQVFQTFVPVYLVSTGFNPGLAGTVVGAAGFVASGVAPTTGYITRRLPAPLVAILGLGCGAVGLVLVPYVSTVPLIYIVSALAGISLGTSLPLLMSLVASAAPPEKRGIALGLRTTANKTAGTAAPVIVGPLISALGMSLGFVVGGLVAAAILLWARVLSTTDARSQVRTDQPTPRNPRGPGTPAQVADERTDGRVPPGHFSGTATRHNFPTR
jgi:MFS family permease